MLTLGGRNRGLVNEVIVEEKSQDENNSVVKSDAFSTYNKQADNILSEKEIQKC